MKEHTHITTEEVKRLLKRFMDGTSTLEEEALLAEFFRSHKVAGEWSAYKEMFALFDEGKVIVEKKSKEWWNYASIAAALLLLLGVGVYFSSRIDKKPELVAQTDTIKSIQRVEEKPVKEQPQEKKENVEEADTIKKAKEIQRIVRPPKRYMAKVEKKDVQLEKNVTPDTIIFSTPPYYIKPMVPSEPAIQKRTLGASAPQRQIDFEHLDYEEMKQEIMQRGNRLLNNDELAINDEDDF